MHGSRFRTGDRSSRRLALVAILAVLALAGVGTAGVASGAAVQPVADTGAVNATLQSTAQPTASCTLSDTEAPPGSEITLTAYESEDADTYRWDKQGDGTLDTDTFDRAYFSFTYDEAGTYEPAVEVRNASSGATDTASCGTLTIDPNEDPDPRLSYFPSSPAVGEQLTFDPGETTDPDGDDIFVWRYDFDDDGSYEAGGETDRQVTHTYTSRGTKTVTLYVEDEHGGSATTTVDFFVGTREPSAACTVERESVRVGESLTVDATASENASVADFDVDGDGSYEYTGRENLGQSHVYEEAGIYEVSVRVRNGDRTDTAFCGTVTVTSNQSPDAVLDVRPSNPRAGESVTFDASGSSDPDGIIETYEWDFDGDNVDDRTTTSPQVEYSYDAAGNYVPSVTVVDDDGARDVTSRDASVGDSLPPPSTFCTVEDTTITIGESTTVDASGSDGPTTVEFDVDGDERYERTDEDDFVISVAYDSAGEYTVLARGTNEGGSEVTECGTITVREPGTETPITERFPRTTEPGEFDETPGAEETPGGEETPTVTTDEEDPGGFVPEIPDEAVPIVGGLLALAGLGGLGYYLYPSGGGGGSGGKSAPPKPPTVPPSSTAARFETGTFLTPPESGPVTVSGLGFEPDLLTFAATTNVRSPDDGETDRSDGWSHGRAVRGADGSIPQTVVSLTDDAGNLDAAMGASSDGHALELDVHNDAPPERVAGQVTGITDDGFEMTVDVEGLRGDRAGDQYVVHYQAFAFGEGSEVEIGHFRTPEFPGSQSIPLSVDADHVTLTATNTLGTVDNRRMTDLPIGFSHGEVVGRANPGQLVRNVTVEPSGPGGTAQAAFDDRALHLLYAYEGEIRGRTTAEVTSLGDSIDLEYETVYSGPAKVGSVESKLVTYVAVDTGGRQPTIGYFQLPESGSNDLLSVDLGFEPRLIEFTTLGIGSLNTDELSPASPLGFGWSHGTAIGGREGSYGIRQYVLNDATDPERSTYEPHTGPRHDGVAAAVRSLADGGRIVGRDELTITGFTDSGFQVAVTDVGTDTTEAAGTRPYVFYKAWPSPDADRTSGGQR
ncbi:PKD domain-containing protein [Halorientalis pallida]|uniref:PKD domain-containing protein n=1 Tax=Halorientalis pallida TaxID=2479928 RepID=A0A498KUT4_9EURY|nr:PKD domain-containing protein [Halorientalis pallida]RXK48650.1 PKD domain-containing protein [Halorientalis pallida]